MPFEGSFSHETESRLPQGFELNKLIQTPKGAEDVLAGLVHSGLSLEKRNTLRDYALIIQGLEQNKAEETDIQRDGYSMHLLPNVEEELPASFAYEAFAYALEHARTLKHATRSDTGSEEVNEIVWKLPGSFEDRAFVLKLTQPSKMPAPDHELRMLQRANKLGLPAPRALGMMKIGDSDFLMMEFVDGRSGQDIWPKLETEGWTPDEIEAAKQEVDKQMKELAQAYRTFMFIDKPWYIKDCLLTFDGHRVTSVFPLDFERAHPYDPTKPDKIRSTPPPPKS